MATTSTLRLPSDLRQWVDDTAAAGHVSANRCIELLLEYARAQGWAVMAAAAGPRLPEDVPQVPGLLSEDRPLLTRPREADPRKWTD